MFSQSDDTVEARLAALAELEILDSPPEQGYDDIVKLACLICDAPVSLVSLVDGDRQWFKAREGFEPCQTDLNSSVCAYALAEPDLLIVPDLTADPRTSANPLVTGDPHIRFYAGAPLRNADDVSIGSLCVIDTKPRPEGLTEKQCQALRMLARQVMIQFDLRRATTERGAAELRRNALFELGDRLRDLQTPEEMILTASEIVGRTLGATRVGFGTLNEDFTLLDVLQDWCASGFTSIVGVHRFADYGNLLEDLRLGKPLVIENVAADPRTRGTVAAMESLQIGSLVNVIIRDRRKAVAVIFVHDDKPRQWSPAMMTFLRNVGDRLEVGVARLRAETEQRVLNQELSHRMKNTMAVIQAIASQTLREVSDQQPVEVFKQRLHALSTAHDVLLRTSWISAGVRDLVVAAMSNFAQAERFSAEGPAIQFGSRASLSLAMLLHELGTNAAKYGALSSERGHVSVNWAVSHEPGDKSFILKWTESGGPAVAEPSRRGFGSRLIRMGLIGTGGASLSYSVNGFEAEFMVDLRQLQT